MKISEIREVFWPLLDPIDEDEKVKEIKIKEITAKNLKKVYEFSDKFYKSEEERLKIVETKSMIFIGSISLIITIIISVTKDFILSANISSGLLSFSNILLIVLLIFIIYLCRTVWFSVKALERKAYHPISWREYTKANKQYDKHMIAHILNCARRNSVPINLKVDNMVMAQEYYLRAIVTIGIYAIIAILGYIFKSTSRISKYMNLSFSYSIGEYILFGLLLFSLIISWLIHRKQNQNKNNKI